MKELKLACGKVALVDDENYEELNMYAWRIAPFGYFSGRIIRGRCNLDNPDPKYGGAFIQLAVHILWRETRFLPGQLVDYLNGNLLDNRKENLYQVKLAAAMKRKKSSQYRGVSYVKKTGQWQATFSIDGRQVWRAFFLDEAEAAAARDRFIIEIGLGGLAHLNFPVIT